VIKKHGHCDEMAKDFLRSAEGVPLSVLLLDYEGTLAPFAVNHNQAGSFAGVVLTEGTAKAHGAAPLL